MHAPAHTQRAPTAWAYAALAVAVLVAFGAVWTRGIQGDDLCMAELAASNDFFTAVGKWLAQWNGRLFLALAQTGSYRLPGFGDPLRAPWFVLHALAVAWHGLACALLLHLLVRSGLAVGAALVPCLVLAVHPLAFEPVLWLAEAYGYVLGNLLVLLAVWAYLQHVRHGSIAWLVASLACALGATLGIEQYLFVLGALAVAAVFAPPAGRPALGRWTPLAIVAVCGTTFVALHFVWFGGTTERLARATQEVHPGAGAALAWRLAWWLSILPDASPYGGYFKVGIRHLQGERWPIVALAFAALFAAWATATARAWHTAPARGARGPHAGLVAVGVAVFAAALLPFLFTGKYGVSLRNLHVALPGLAVAGAAALDLIARHPRGRSALRLALPPAVALFVATSLTIDLGAQRSFAQSWRLHRNVIGLLQTHADAIRDARAVEIVGIPTNPYQGSSQLNSAWAFPCLTRWVVGDDVKGWNNLMHSGTRAEGFERSVRLRVPEPVDGDNP